MRKLFRGIWIVNIVGCALLAFGHAYFFAKNHFGYVCNSNGQCWSSREYGFDGAMRQAQLAFKMRNGHYAYGPQWTKETK